jgi:ATP-dependent DNA ligase
VVCELAAAVAALPAPTLVLDGEIAVFDQQLRSRFELLRGPAADIVHTPPVYIAFDVLYRNGVDLTDRPLCERRTQLEDQVAGGDLVFPVRRLAPNGLEAWAMVLERGYEGWVGQGRGQPVPRRDHALVAEGEGPGLDRRRGSVAAPADSALRRSAAARAATASPV